MKAISDEQILELIHGGIKLEQGFKALMYKYQEKLYWHVRRMVGQHEDANDIMQNTFIKVYKSIHKFEGKSKLYTWLYRIAKNEAITFLNKRSKRPMYSIDEEELRIEHRLKAESHLNGAEVIEKLQLATNGLPEKQRMVFDMRYYDEMSYNEMSEILGTSVGALKASYHHAVKKIEKYLVRNAL